MGGARRLADLTTRTPTPIGEAFASEIGQRILVAFKSL